jgi:hypothetical protein
VGDDWDRASVSVRASRIAPGPAELVPDGGEWDALAELRPEGQEGWVGGSQTLEGRRVVLRYDGKHGLRIEMEE